MKTNERIINAIMKVMTTNIKSVGVCTHGFDTLKVMLSNNGKCYFFLVFISSLIRFIRQIPTKSLLKKREE